MEGLSQYIKSKYNAIPDTPCYVAGYDGIMMVGTIPNNTEFTIININEPGYTFEILENGSPKEISMFRYSVCLKGSNGNTYVIGLVNNLIKNFKDPNIGDYIPL